MKNMISTSLVLVISLFSNPMAKAENVSALGFMLQYPNIIKLDTAMSKYLLMLWASSNRQLSQDPSLLHDTDFKDNSACILQIPTAEVTNVIVEKTTELSTDDLAKIETFAKSEASRNLANFYELNAKQVLDLKPFETVNPNHLKSPLTEKDKETIQTFYQTTAGMNFMKFLNTDFASKMLEISREHCN